MDCTDVKTHLLARSDPAEPMAALGEHLADCPPCRALAANSGRLAQGLGALPAAVPSDDLGFEAVSALIAADQGLRARLASRPTWERRLFVVVALLGAGALNLLIPRADLGVYPAGRMLGVMLVLAIVGGATGWAALQPAHRPPLPANWLITLLGVGVLLPVLIAVLPVAHLDHAASGEGVGGMFAKKTVACFIYGCVFAVPVIATAWLFDRSGSFRFRRAALLVAVGGGVAGNLALQAHCPITERAHLVLGHATVGMGLLGAFFVTRTLSARP